VFICTIIVSIVVIHVTYVDLAERLVGPQVIYTTNALYTNIILI
jgi:hypothetical protein